MIEIITADITELKVDAIVNAANCSLLIGAIPHKKLSIKNL